MSYCDEVYAMDSISRRQSVIDSEGWLKVKAEIVKLKRKGGE